ncbi:MAG: radical SAM protein [Candidatus Omnitrophota bacterium]
MLFINPAVDKISQPTVVKKFTYACFPTSIGFLGAYLREKNKDEVGVIDEQIVELTQDRLEGELAKLKHPRIVGIPNLTITTKRVIELTGMVKSIDPKVTVVLGGIHPSVLPEDILIKSGADVAVRKEGELTLGELYECLKNGKDYKDIKGISYKTDSKVFHNSDRELIKNLDDLPPFYYELFEKDSESYGDFGTIISSRGCPFDCIFCSQRAISGKAYRFYSATRIVEDIKKLVDRYGQKKIWFIDDSITINKRRLYELLDAIIASGYHKKVAFIGTSRGKEVDYEMLERLKDCNFVSLAFGVETGSERLMKIINKKELVEDNLRAIKMCNEVGILADASLIFGLPSETRKDRYDTLKLMCKLPLDGARFNIAIPYPGTELFRIGKEENGLHIHENWTNFSNQHYMQGDDLSYVPKDTHPPVLIFDTIVANLTFYFRPRILYKMLFKSPLSGGGVLSLPKRWYFKPDVLLAFTKFFLIIFKRALTISLKVLILSITRKKAERTNIMKG